MPTPTALDVLVRFDAQAGWWIDAGFGRVGPSYARLSEATLMAISYLRHPGGHVLVQTGAEWTVADPPVLLDFDPVAAARVLPRRPGPGT